MLKQNFLGQRGFSSIIVMMMLAFLSLISIGVLHILIQEAKLSKLGSNTIIGYAGAEGGIEYGLLKIKNHEAGFEDSIKVDVDGRIAFKSSSNSDPDAHLLLGDNSVFGNAQVIQYEIESRSHYYEGTISKQGIEVIPLFYDIGEAMQGKSLQPNFNTSDIQQTQRFQFKIESGGDLIWTIVGDYNDTSSTPPVIRTKSIGSTLIAAQTLGPAGDVKSGEMRDITEFGASIRPVDISEFLGGIPYYNSYLILYNQSDVASVKYSITTNPNDPTQEPIIKDYFTLPRMSITASSRIGELVQRVQFKQEKSELVEMLQYSVYQ